jgi:hypothetical protein
MSFLRLQGIGIYKNLDSVTNSFSRKREKGGMRAIQIDEIHLNAAFGIENADRQFVFLFIKLPHPNPLPLAGEGVLADHRLVSAPVH